MHFKECFKRTSKTTSRSNLTNTSRRASRRISRNLLRSASRSNSRGISEHFGKTRNSILIRTFMKHCKARSMKELQVSPAQGTYMG